jgi:hypothetical protein
MRCADMRVTPTWMIVAVGLAAPTTAGAAIEQIIATRDVGADVAVDATGRAFLVSPSMGHYAGTFSSVRLRSAAPGAAFGAPRMLMRSRADERAVDAGVAADGGGVIAVQSVARRHRRVRVALFTARGAVGRPVTVSSPGDRADFAASAVARSGAAVVVWFRHRADGRWRLEGSIRESRTAAFGPPLPVSAFARRACCTSVSVAIGERGDAVATWSATSRGSVWAALRSPGRAFRRPQRLAGTASDVPKAVVGAGGTAALIYSVQHVPLRSDDGLALRLSARGHAFGAATHVNPGGGVTIGDAAVTPGGKVLVAWTDRFHGARIHVSEAGPGEALAAVADLGARVAAERVAVAADDDGRAVVAWSQMVATAPAYREQAVAATRRAGEAAFGAAVALGRPWRAAAPASTRLVPGGRALVVWRGSRFGGRANRRAALAVTRLP